MVKQLLEKCSEFYVMDIFELVVENQTKVGELRFKLICANIDIYYMADLFRVL